MFFLLGVGVCVFPWKSKLFDGLHLEVSFFTSDNLFNKTDFFSSWCYMFRRDGETWSI